MEEEQRWASIVIQSGVRQFLSVAYTRQLRLLRSHSAATIIQSRIRGVLARTRCTWLRLRMRTESERHKAAVSIQSIARLPQSCALSLIQP